MGCAVRCVLRPDHRCRLHGRWSRILQCRRMPKVTWLHALPASALAAVAPARMGFTPVGLLCATAAEVAPHPRRAVSTQAKSIERSRRRPWKPTRARSEAWLRESKNCSRESTSSLAAERSSRAPGPALPLVLLPSRLLRARYRRGRRCRCARTCMFTYPHAPCGLCLLAYRVYSP